MMYRMGTPMELMIGLESASSNRIEEKKWLARIMHGISRLREVVSFFIPTRMGETTGGHVRRQYA
jgi:hypothetical protein